MSFCAKAYAQQRLKKTETQPPSEATALAYRRFLSELRKKWDYIYSPPHAQVRLNFIEAAFLYDEGLKKGKNFELMDWQRFALSQIYGWIVAGTERDTFPEYRFKEAYIEIAKKNGKTTFIAAVAITHCLLDSYISPAVYCFANGQEQARICLQRVKRLSEASEALSPLFVARQSRVECKIGARAGFIEALPANIRTREGVEPSLCVCDEYHHAASSDMVEVMKGSMLSRENGLTLIITTAGELAHTPCFDYRQRHLLAIKKKMGVNDRQFTYVFALDPEDNWKDVNLWHKANPSMHHIVHETALIDRYKSLNVDSDGDVNRFKALHLGLWAQGGAQSFITEDDWGAMRYGVKENSVLEVMEERKRHTICCAGIDMSIINDFTALNVLARDEEKSIWWSHTFMFTTEAVVRDSEIDQKTMNLQRYIDSGELFVCGKKTISSSAFVNYVENISDSVGGLRSISYDKWGATFIMQEVAKRLRGVQLQSMPNNAWIAFGETRKILQSGNFRHDGGELMQWQVGNVRVRNNRWGKPLVDKASEKAKIDGVMALIYSIDAAAAIGRGLLPDAEKAMSDYKKKYKKHEVV